MFKTTKEPKVMAGVEAEWQAFWVQNGAILHNLRELEAALKTMSDKTFNYHVTKAKNDFSTWIAEVLGEKDIAFKLARFKTKAAFLRTLSNILEKEYN